MHYETLFAPPARAKHYLVGHGGWATGSRLPGGLVRRDGSAKPAYDELMKRVKDEWWLSPIEMVTDASGKVMVSGFPGEYDVGR